MFLRSERGAARLTLIFSIILLAGFFFSLSIGRYPIGLWTTVKILFSRIFPIAADWEAIEERVVLALRLPRVLMALVSGAGLGLCGAVFQGIFRNPLASPGVLGVTAGAGFGAALGILLFGWGIPAQVSAFLFGALAIAATYTITRKTHANSLLIFVLAGVIVNMFFQSLISLVKFTADTEDKLPSIVYWLMGSLSGVSYQTVAISIPVIIVSSVFLILLRWRINVLSLGEETVSALGINLKTLMVLLLFFTTVNVSAVVSAAGIVGWIGLIVPHLGRMIVGPDHRVLLPFSALLGSLFFLLIDDIARTISPLDIPLSILTAIIGAPFFIILLIRSHGEWRSA